MATYGIVIGIKSYTNPRVPSLITPVEDALRMVAWIVAKGKVPPDNLIVLLNPVATRVDGSLVQLAETLGQLRLTTDDFNTILKRLDDTGRLRPAMQDQILKAMKELGGVQVPDGGERLYFYYAGHGLASRLNFGNEDALVPANYEEDICGAISVSSIVRYFQSLKFPEQLFFFDCCRNILSNDDGGFKEEELAKAPPPKPLDLIRRVPDQFIYNATAPGLKALDGRGLLTDALLDGLLGKGSAVAWVGGPQKSYAVRAVRLFDYIVQRYATRPQPAVLDKVNGKNQVQEPRLGGDRSNFEPVVVTMPEADLPDLTLTLKISPDDAHPIRQVTLTSSGAKYEFKDVANIPLKVTLKPRTYFLEVDAGDQWLPGGDPGPWSIDVFDPLDYAVSFNKNAVPVAVPVPTPPQGKPGPGMAEPKVEVVAVPGDLATPAGPPSVGSSLPVAEMAPVQEVPKAQPDGGGVPGRGHLVVTSDDPMAMIEVVDEFGAPVMGAGGRPILGTSPLDCPGLEPGHYRARLKTPSGPVSERSVLAEAGQVVPVKLTIPSRTPGGLVLALANQLKSSAGGSFSKQLVAAAEPTLMSVLTLATEAVNRTRGLGGAGDDPPTFGAGTSSWGEAQLGLDGPGIAVILAAETAPVATDADADAGIAGPSGEERLDSPEKIDAYLRAITIRCWPFDRAPGPPQAPETTSTPGIVGFASRAKPGPCWLWVGSSSRGAAFSLPVVDGRTTRMLLHLESNGQIHAYVFMPSCRAEAPTDPGLLRRLDLAQHFFRKGQLREAAATIEPLIVPGKLDTLDPIAGCIAGYLMIRERNLGRLEGLADRMLALYPDLPDSHVLRAFHRDASGKVDKAVDGYREALDRGFPVSAQFLRHLAEGVARHEIKHGRTKLLKQIDDRLIPGGQWTAWVPDADWDGITPNP